MTAALSLRPKFSSFLKLSITPQDGGHLSAETRKKPSIEEMIKYATPQVRKFISQFDLPAEQRKEVEQDAFLRIVEAYPEVDPDKGWKSFVYSHCRGAVLDYVDGGKGFKETRKSLREEKAGGPNQWKIKHRVSLSDDSGDSVDIDDVLGKNGHSSEFSNIIKTHEIKWDLLARMCSQDEVLHAFVKNYLCDISLENIGPVFGICRARVGQLVQAFIERFDDPEHADCPWFKQTCFALGISERMGLEDIDQSEVMGFKVGWGLPKVDLYSLEPCLRIREDLAQMSLFGEDDANG